ncbi:MATE efflux family protein [Abeliophyllum distichum]|uniref:MATE efflux family protein n=1 Tax=Abeliophyllum distichum TaxID=126358 RepID=A0ABD1Q055_9LAMI
MRHQWAKFFTSDKEILKLTALVLPIVGLCELGNCPQTTGCGVLRGSARPTIGANINIGSFYLVGMPVAILMGFVLKMGFAGLWLGLLAAQGSCALLMFYVLCTTDWIVEAERANKLTTESNMETNTKMDSNLDERDPPRSQRIGGISLLFAAKPGGSFSPSPLVSRWKREGISPLPRSPATGEGRNPLHFSPILGWVG